MECVPQIVAMFILQISFPSELFCKQAEIVLQGALPEKAFCRLWDHVNQKEVTELRFLIFF